jgi:ligand-binding sensor domain-containing protein
MIRLRFFTVLLFSVVVTAWCLTDSISIGETSVEWLSFMTSSPAITFTVTPTHVWYATDIEVGRYTLNKMKEKIVCKNLGAIPTSGVTTIVADASGTVWFGTSKGIAITADNGISFKNLTTTQGLPANEITVIRPSENGTVFIGTHAGLAIYNKGEISILTQDDGLSGNDIRDIDIDENGKAWFATNRGVCSFDGKTWQKYNSSSGLTEPDAHLVAWDPRRDELWVAAGEKSVFSWDGKEWNEFMDLQKDITSIMIDTQSRVWIGSKNGLIKYNESEWLTDPSGIGFTATQVNHMFRDTNGNLWFALVNSVLMMKNPYPY